MQDPPPVITVCSRLTNASGGPVLSNHGHADNWIAVSTRVKCALLVLDSASIRVYAVRLDSSARISSN